MLIGTEACAPLDTAQRNVKKNTECKETLGRMLDVDGANIVRTRTGSRGKGEILRVYIRRGFEREFAPLYEVSAGDGGAMFRTHSAQQQSGRRSWAYIPA